MVTNQCNKKHYPQNHNKIIWFSIIKVINILIPSWTMLYCIAAIFRCVWTRSRKKWGCCNHPQTLQHFPPTTQTFPNMNDCYSMKNQMSLKWSGTTHGTVCRNPKPSPSPCQVFFWPFKPLSHNSCASRIKRSKQCEADKGAAVCLFMPRPRVRSSNAAIYLQSSQCSCCAFLERVWFYCCGETTESFPGRPLCIKEDRTSEGRMEGEVVCDRLTPNTTNICSSSRTEAKHIHSWSV